MMFMLMSQILHWIDILEPRHYWVRIVKCWCVQKPGAIQIVRFYR